MFRPNMWPSSRLWKSKVRYIKGTNEFINKTWEPMQSVITIIWTSSLKVHKCTYSTLTSWSRVLLERLTGLQLVKKFPTFYGTRRFITAVTSARHLYLSWASSFQSILPYPTSWRSTLILSSHLCLGICNRIRKCCYRSDGGRRRFRLAVHPTVSVVLWSVPLFYTFD
jgi:hypothetical protein